MAAQRRRRLGIATLSIALVAAAGGCTTDPADEVLVVHAAASLSSAMEDIAADFELTHPGVDVRVNVGGSSGLATLIIEGAPGDVFASANVAQMSNVTEAGLATDPHLFATNVLTIAVAPGNPHDIHSLEDLRDTELDVVVCAPPVPCGAVTAAVEEASGVTLSPVSEEMSVTDVMAKITSGQADAGLVYTTDVQTAGDTATGIPLGLDPAYADAASTDYAIAALAPSDNPDLADAFVAHVLSDSGQDTLERYGFGQP